VEIAREYVRRYCRNRRHVRKQKEENEGSKTQGGMSKEEMREMVKSWIQKKQQKAERKK
jgi:hypothetical protein